MNASSQAEGVIEASGQGSVLTYRDALLTAMEDAMRADSSVVLMGEDVAEAGGPFKTSEGLFAAFGRERVIDTPICENGFLGVALGMAVTGLRPVVEIMFSDFLPMAGDAIVNEISKFRFMSGGQMIVPLTIRSIGGATGRFGAQHSATGESWYMQVPGLKTVTASSPASAYRLLRTCVEDDGPTLFIEHKAMYAVKGTVDRDSYAPSPVGKSRVVREGSSCTVVASLLMVHRAMAAAQLLAAEGVDVEVIDIQWVTPLDYDGIAASAVRTGALIVVEEQYHAGGWGATVISELTQRGVPLRTRPQAVSLPFVPIAFSPPLEDECVPSVNRIAAAIRDACGNGGIA